MKQLQLTLFILLTILSTLPVQANTNKLFTEQGYPYNLLIKRTDEIKIIYSEKGDLVNCRIELNWQKQKTTTKNITVNRFNFNKKPFASCLPREQAKMMLAKTFN